MPRQIEYRLPPNSEINKLIEGHPSSRKAHFLELLKLFPDGKYCDILWALARWHNIHAAFDTTFEGLCAAYTAPQNVRLEQHNQPGEGDRRRNAGTPLNLCHFVNRVTQYWPASFVADLRDQSIFLPEQPAREVAGLLSKIAAKYTFDEYVKLTKGLVIPWSKRKLGLRMITATGWHVQRMMLQMILQGKWREEEREVQAVVEDGHLDSFKEVKRTLEKCRQNGKYLCGAHDGGHLLIVPPPLVTASKRKSEAALRRLEQFQKQLHQFDTQTKQSITSCEEVTIALKATDQTLPSDINDAFTTIVQSLTLYLSMVDEMRVDHEDHAAKLNEHEFFSVPSVDPQHYTRVNARYKKQVSFWTRRRAERDEAVQGLGCAKAEYRAKKAYCDGVCKQWRQLSSCT